MRITITGVDFNYADGVDKECTSVDVKYMTNGFDFILDQARPFNITHDQYVATKEDKDQLRALVADKIIADATQFVENVQAYKDSLEQAE
ncbi:hypothetical protein [Oceanobacillus oncorhynchi]|uniref:hypothetical protein n=1 Tax=Oceanobacillus oncorhynchi TaxID=545501 RepID=UPI0025A36F92|nr:hypothetical protein [Oceanobacillus oncorhynchi]MDM8098653.1 hypothetical protein [Oceanobacillus oncorhynchi]